MAKAATKQKAEAAIQVAAVSKIGASEKRTLLEDRSRAGTLVTAGGLEIALAVVADGIGGENAGERAAEVTIKTVFEHCERSNESDIPRMLEAALVEANRRVHKEAKASRRKSNMGSTAAVAAIHHNRLYVANVGDSRVYLLRGKQAFCLTMDHTWERDVLRTGKLSPKEAARHPRKDEIVRSIGYERDIEVDLGLWMKQGEESEGEARASQGLPLKTADVVLVCSDGLIKTRHDNRDAHYLEESEFANLIAGRAANQAVDALVKKALSRGVDDNVSAVILAMPGGKRSMRPAYPFVGAGAALLGLVGVGVFALPRVMGRGADLSAMPTIPPLPSGVAYVSEVIGLAESIVPEQHPAPLRREDLVAAGGGVLLRTGGSGSYIRLGLADQTIVYVGPDTQIGMPQIGDQATSTNSLFELQQGILLVAASAPSGGRFIVRVPSGATATLSGSVMGVTFNPESGTFDLDCFEGVCEILSGVQGTFAVRLTARQHVWLDSTGASGDRDATRNELYAFAEYCGGLVPTPTGMPLAGGATLALRTQTPTQLGPIFRPPTVKPTEPPWAPGGQKPPAPTPVPPTQAPQPSDTPEPPEPTAPPATEEPPPPPEQTEEPKPGKTKEPGHP